jgi:hypothetical protein
MSDFGQDVPRAVLTQDNLDSKFSFPTPSTRHRLPTFPFKPGQNRKSDANHCLRTVYNESKQLTKPASASHADDLATPTVTVENTQVGPFLILRRLGSNRRQQVFHARQVKQNRNVALKFIKVPPDVDWDAAIDKIDRESKQLQKMKHPNLVGVYGAGFADDRFFFATELIEGESLASILSRRGKLAPDQVVAYGRQIAEVLHYLHEQGLIHSKLTPEKILITPEDTVKVADLRLNRAKRRRWDSPRRRDLELAAYMAPEHFTEGSCEKSDFYSLGVMLFEMLSGKLPYPPDTMGRMHKNKIDGDVPEIATHVMNCPIWLNQTVTQMLDPNTRKRPHSAAAIIMAFDEIQKIDADKKAAVTQMTSGFNALTAGKDKTEARRLLGKKQQDKPTADEPFYQSILFQIGALAVIAALVTFLLWPKSAQQKLAQAKTLIESDQSSQWIAAREQLASLMTDDGSPVSNEATELYFLSRRKTLIARAEAGKSSRLDTENFQKFSKAVNLQQTGQDEDAADIFSQLTKTIAPDGDDRHIYEEAKSRYQALASKFEWPTKPLDLLAKVVETRAAKSERELMQAQAMLGEMSIKFAGEEQYAEVVSVAGKRLREIKAQLVALRTEEGQQQTNVATP